MKNRFPSALANEIDDLIRTGKGALAAEKLSQWDIARVHKSERWALAFLAWRSGKPEWGIEWLNPIVRPKAGLRSEASPRTIAEYATCLIKIGAITEATTLLKSIDPASTPQALLYSAFALAGHWAYADTIPLLERYVSHADLDPYQRLVGLTNLAAALVFEKRHAEGRKIIERVMSEAARAGHALLVGNALHIRAGSLAMERKLDEAERLLAEAEARLVKTGWLDAFFVRKWRAVVKFMRSNDPQILDAVRNEARERRVWETVRDCDRFEAIYSPNARLAQHLIFGTPHSAFRHKILSDFPGALGLPETYSWKLNGQGGPSIVLFGRSERDKAALKVGHLRYRVLGALCSDFYRPFGVGDLFGRVFPGEFFNPNSSPKRVYEAIRRVRAWMEEKKFPLAISENKGAYRLEAKGPCELIIPSLEERDFHPTGIIDRLRAMGLSVGFTLREASQELGVPERTLSRYLAEALADGKIEREGAGRKTKYRVVENSRQAA